MKSVDKNVKEGDAKEKQEAVDEEWKQGEEMVQEIKRLNQKVRT